jgi:hypothetical protein
MSFPQLINSDCLRRCLTIDHDPPWQTPVRGPPAFEYQPLDHLLDLLVPDALIGGHGQNCLFHTTLKRFSSLDHIVINDGHIDWFREIDVGNYSAFNLDDEMIHIFLLS